MSAVGFDLSTDTCGVAYVPVDNITYRDAINREDDKDNPAAICFDKKHRIIGKRATGQPNCFSQVMKIIGKTMSDLNPEPELSPLIEKDLDGLLRVRVSDREKDLHFTPTQLLAMIISDLKATAEMAVEVDDIGDCCIGIPGYFSKSQRTAVRQAAEIAGLHRVSLLEATTAIALGHAIIRRNVHKHSTEYNILVVDIGPSAMQVSTVSLTSEALDVLSFAYDLCTSEESFVDSLVHYFKKTSEGSDDVSLREVCRGLKEQSKIMGKKEALMYGGQQVNRSKFEAICAPIWDRMKVIVEEAVTDAGIGKEKINSILVSGSGAKIWGIEQLLEKLFPRQSKAGQKHVILAVDSVAKGCAIHCAITSKAFKDGKEHLRHKSMKERLLKFKVSDKWPLVKDKTMEFQVADCSDGRCELTTQEMIDAQECERKMAVREKIRVNISDILKINDFAKEEEIKELNNLNGQLCKEDLDTEYLYVKSVKKDIMARKEEHDNSHSVSTAFTKKVSEYECFLTSRDPKYRTIKQTAKDSFQEHCKKAREWLRLKIESLSQKPKSEDSISFIFHAKQKLEFLKQAWDSTKQEREPESEELEYDITDSSSFTCSIDDLRAQLLKDTKKKQIKGCFVLPQQTEAAGAPYKWFHLKLIGKDEESTTLHTKHHNVYNMAFSNREGQIYEMGPGCKPAEEQQPAEDEEQPEEEQPEEEQPAEEQPAEEQPEEEQPEEEQPAEEQPAEDQPAEEQPDEDQPKHQDISDLISLTIPGAVYAGFNCDYISMISPKRLKCDEQLMEKVLEFKVGIEPWHNSIHVLSYHGCEPAHHETCALCRAPHAVPRAVMCISVMLNECTRMDGLKDPVGDGLEGLNLTELLMEFIWHWRSMSCFLRTWDATKKVTEFVLRLTVSQLTKVYDADEVGDIMHLILNVTSAGKEFDIDDMGQQFPPSGGDDGANKDSGKKQAGRPPPSAPGPDGATKEQPQPQPQPPIGHGHTLLQIFSVTLEGVNLGDIHAILVHEERGTHAMYSCGGEESSSRHSFDLSGPSIAISSESFSILEVIPKIGSTVQRKRKNKKTGKMYGPLMRLDEGFGSYDKHRLKTMPYGNGKVLVSYAILTTAVEANLEIQVLLPKTGLPYKVSGSLTVTQQTGANNLSVLPTYYITPCVRLSYFPQELPLSSNVLAVKCGECIRFEGNLSIGEDSLNINEALEVPREIGFIKTVGTSWVGKPELWYRVSMILISRNI